jgi:NADH-quinone oxidoreductase subunit L
MGVDIGAHPGLLFVAATLLPLAAFLILLLAGGLRAFLRPRPGEAPGGLYELLGGDRPVRAGAYIATGAIGAAFFLCLVGFILFSRDYNATFPHEHAALAEHQIQAERERVATSAHGDQRLCEKEFEERWSGRWTWAEMGSDGEPSWASKLTVGYRIDHLSGLMFLMVTLVSTLIHLFSIGYMSEELEPTVEDHEVHTASGHLRRRGRFGRFFLFLSFFCFSMLNLILADNLFQVFLSWELVGICSYLLIGFYYERRSASNAANKAFITNRVGDAGFVIGLLVLWTYVGTFNFEEIFRRIRSPLEDARGQNAALAAQVVRAELAVGRAAGVLRITAGQETAAGPPGSQVLIFPVEGEVRAVQPGDLVQVGAEQKIGARTPRYRSMPYWLLVVAGLGIFLGCVGKSAQFPLHVWLPDAMEGPTPVSALIHAATMVAAGVYLVGRVYPLFTPESRLVIAYTGGITLFLAATIALVMTDIKKVLAYSTVSQLGYMMLALGVGGWVAGLFHLITHAFFKALLFLCSGSVIYGCHHVQDMQRMGGLYPKMKVTAITMLVGVLTIAGIPLFSGWYSKDAILAQALGFAYVHPEHALLFVLPLATAGITALYMARMWFLTFAGKPRDPHVYEHAHESPWVMTVPLIVLAIGSVCVAWGWPLYDAEVSYLSSQIEHSQHRSVPAEFGLTREEKESMPGFVAKEEHQSERFYAQLYHSLTGSIALALVAVGILFSSLLYYSRVLDPADAARQFPAVHRFLVNKWYFDELYGAVLVRPALVVAGWCRAFDTYVIDGIVDAAGRGTVRLSDWDGRFDLGIIDGLVNLTARVVYGTGARLRGVQTGFIRSYVLFLVLAAVGIFIVLSYFVAMAAAGT